jgi:hypothetical protein
MSVARDAVLGNFNGPLCVVWKYGTVHDWQQWRTVNRKFRRVNDVIYLKQWKIYIIDYYIPDMSWDLWLTYQKQEVGFYCGLIAESKTIQGAWKRAKVLKGILKMRRSKSMNVPYEVKTLQEYYEISEIKERKMQYDVNRAAWNELLKRDENLRWNPKVHYPVVLEIQSIRENKKNTQAMKDPAIK